MVAAKTSCGRGVSQQQLHLCYSRAAGLLLRVWKCLLCQDRPESVPGYSSMGVHNTFSHVVQRPNKPNVTTNRACGAGHRHNMALQGVTGWQVVEGELLGLVITL
jgi:hypothetical protein